MGIWFLSNLARLAEERAAIDTLQQEADWLAGAEWTLSSSELALDAAIVAHGHTYSVRMTYPKHFPNTPPSVCPADPSDSWSSHQYGDGTLCLEWGPDTWVSTVTGAQVLESAYRLLDIENPLGADTPRVAPSRHYLTLGQELCGVLERAYLSGSLHAYLKLLPNTMQGVMTYSIQPQRDSYTLLIQELHPASGPAWQDLEIPNALRKKPGVWIGQGLFFTTALPSRSLTGLSSFCDLEAALCSADYTDISLSDMGALKALGLEKPPQAILITDQNQRPHIYSVYSENRLFRVRNLPAGEQAALPRTPVELEPLSEKRIGIVGLGSLGSQVALSLARMGVKRFWLVDDDILMPENICRHALDWQSVGEHKTAAVAQAIDRIVPGAEIDISRVNVTGMENPATLSGVLNKLSRCDVVLDMTAVSQVFNLLTGVCRQSAKPLVWAEVFAGGFGGLVARSRPDKDPSPQVVRAAYLRYTEENPFTEGTTRAPYALEDEDERVMTASDADVSIIAAHAANLAADTVLEREPSYYPYSQYLIGLRRSWVFNEPLHNIPIDTAHFQDEVTDDDLPPRPVLHDSVDFIKDLLEKACDQNSAPEQDSQSNG